MLESDKSLLRRIATMPSMAIPREEQGALTRLLVYEMVVWQSINIGDWTLFVTQKGREILK